MKLSKKKLKKRVENYYKTYPEKRLKYLGTLEQIMESKRERTDEIIKEANRNECASLKAQ